jgi:hypothetical protein
MRITTKLGFAASGSFTKEDAIGNICRAMVNELPKTIDSPINITSMMETSFGSRFQWTPVLMWRRC